MTGSTASERNCPVAMVGAGPIAREHLRAFAAVPGTTIVGIHSRTRARAEALAAEFGVPTVCASVAELYERTCAKLVVVAVPILAMNPVSQTCFDYPWTVLLEKPAGYNLADAEEIQRAATARGICVLVALNRRSLSSTRTALTDLAKDESRRFIHVQDQQSVEVAASLGHPQLVVGNWMYANSIHTIDYLCLFGRGEIASVMPIWAWDARQPQVVVAKVEFESGDLGLYEGIWRGPGPWAVSITTPERRWEMRPLEQAAVQQVGHRRLEPVVNHRWDREFTPGFRLQAEMAVEAAAGRASDLPTLAEAMRTMQLIHAIFGQ